MEALMECPVCKKQFNCPDIHNHVFEVHEGSHLDGAGHLVPSDEFLDKHTMVDVKHLH